MNTDITNMPLIELKAMAYDQLAQIEQCQMNLKLINAEIQKKFQQPKIGGKDE